MANSRADRSRPIRPGQLHLTTGQAARLLGCSHHTITKAVDDGTLEGFRLPESVHRRVTAAGLVRWMEAAGMDVPADLRAALPLRPKHD